MTCPSSLLSGDIPSGRSVLSPTGTSALNELRGTDTTLINCCISGAHIAWVRLFYSVSERIQFLLVIKGSALCMASLFSRKAIWRIFIAGWNLGAWSNCCLVYRLSNVHLHSMIGIKEIWRILQKYHRFMPQSRYSSIFRNIVWNFNFETYFYQYF